jgi:hypothetical protein
MELSREASQRQQHQQRQHDEDGDLIEEEFETSDEEEEDENEGKEEVNANSEEALATAAAAAAMTDAIEEQRQQRLAQNIRNEKDEERTMKQRAALDVARSNAEELEKAQKLEEEERRKAEEDAAAAAIAALEEEEERLAREEEAEEEEENARRAAAQPQSLPSPPAEAVGFGDMKARGSRMFPPPAPLIAATDFSTRAVFDKYDADDSGTLDVTELVAALIAVTGKRVTTKAAMALIEKHARNADKAGMGLKLAEFEKMVKEIEVEREKKKARKVRLALLSLSDCMYCKRRSERL